MKLEGIISEADFLSDSEKDFLKSKVSDLSPVDKLKVQAELQAKRRPSQLNELVIKRQDFIEQETPQADPIGDFIAKFIPKKNQTPVSVSILSQGKILGSQPPRAVKTEAPQIQNIQDITHPSQLQYITPQMLESNNAKQDDNHAIQNILDHIDNIILPVDVLQRRVYLLDYLRSPLYTAYVNTGLAGMRHPELKPSVLNTLYQINENYLPTKLFSTTAKFSSPIRQLCGL